MESGRVLARAQMDEPEIVCHLPFEMVEGECVLEARDRCKVALLTEETHANIIPKLRAARRLRHSRAVLCERHVHVGVLLNDRSGAEDRVRITWLVGQRIPQKREAFHLLSTAQVEQTNLGVKRRTLWRGPDRFREHFHRLLRVALRRVRGGEL